MRASAAGLKRDQSGPIKIYVLKSREQPCSPKKKKSDSPEACVHRNRQVKCSSSFLFICRAGRRRSAWLKCVETWSLAKSVRSIVKSCHIGPELMKWLSRQRKESRAAAAAASPSSSSSPPTAIKPGGPRCHSLLLSAAVREGHMLYTFSTRSTLNRTRAPPPAACNQRLLSTQEFLIKFM